MELYLLKAKEFGFENLVAIYVCVRVRVRARVCVL